METRGWLTNNRAVQKWAGFKMIVIIKLIFNLGALIGFN